MAYQNTKTNSNQISWGIWNFDLEPERRRLVHLAATTLKEALIEHPVLHIMTSSHSSFRLQFAIGSELVTKIFVHLFTGRDKNKEATKIGMVVPQVTPGFNFQPSVEWLGETIRIASESVGVELPSFTIVAFNLQSGQGIEVVQQPSVDKLATLVVNSSGAQAS